MITKLLVTLFQYLWHRCAVCAGLVRNEWLCHECIRTISPVLPIVRTLPDGYCYQVYALGAYAGALQHLIVSKLHSTGYAKIVAASGLLSEWVAQNAVLRNMILSIDYVSYIPADPKRLVERGFDHAYRYAYAVADILDKPLCQFLIKSMATPSQSLLSVADRRKNIRNAFSFSSDMLQMSQGSIVLIDDVCTTGSTLDEAVSVLHEKGFAVTVLVLARVVN